MPLPNWHAEKQRERERDREENEYETSGVLLFIQQWPFHPVKARCHTVNPRPVGEAGIRAGDLKLPHRKLAQFSARPSDHSPPPPR